MVLGLLNWSKESVDTNFVPKGININFYGRTKNSKLSENKIPKKLQESHKKLLFVSLHIYQDDSAYNAFVSYNHTKDKTTKLLVSLANFAVEGIG